MKLELKSVKPMTFGMALCIPGALLGLVACAVAAFAYPFESAGVGRLVALVLGGTAGGGFVSFSLGFVAAWSYNAFASLTGGAEVEMKEAGENE